MPETSSPEASISEVSSGPLLAIVLHAGDYARVSYGLTVAAAALAANRPVSLFFTMGATVALLAGGPTTPGWQGLAAGADGVTAAAADQRLIAQGLGGIEEYLAATVGLGATFMVCEMGLRACGLDGAALRSDIPITAGGLVTFLAGQRPGDQLLFI